MRPKKSASATDVLRLRLQLPSQWPAAAELERQVAGHTMRTFGHLFALMGFLAFLFSGCTKQPQVQSTVSSNETPGEVSFERTTGLRDKVITNPKDEASLRALVNLLDDNSALNRANAAACLRQLGENKVTRDQVAPIAVPALASRIDSVGREAPNALAAYGPLSAPAVPQLIRAVERYPTQDTGLFAAEALGNIGPAAKDAVPALTNAKDKKWIGEYATEALRKINGP